MSLASNNSSIGQAFMRHRDKLKVRVGKRFETEQNSIDLKRDFGAKKRS